MSYLVATIGAMCDSDLPPEDRALLDFARRWYKYAGKQEQDILDAFDMNATRFWQRINVIIDDPRALAYDPTTVKRYQRIRATRQQARSARRRG